MIMQIKHVLSSLFILKLILLTSVTLYIKIENINIIKAIIMLVVATRKGVFQLFVYSFNH